MKSYLVAGGLVALLLTGCSQKNVDLESSKGTDSGYQSGNTSTTDLTNGNLKELDLSKDYDAALNPDGSIKSVYFDFDQFSIKGESQDIVVVNSKYFNKSQNQDMKIKLEGNCDEWGTDEYNTALGLKRAKAVKDSLIASGVDASRVSMVSYGENSPVCQEKTKECWAKNRRVDFKLVP